ncbi:MAG: PLP-dependent aminotransferase family protein [Acidobacteria bacterium]|nr:PLP-dependent aminotransferase family protein [Acidobacteriota bacterium]
MSLDLADWTGSLKRSALQEMLVATARPGVVSFALGLPAADHFPTRGLQEAIGATLAADPRALQYGPPSSDLRSFAAALMRRRGVTCSPEQVFLTAGAQQGMALLTRLLVNPGDPVLLEDHGYTGFHQAIAPLRPRLVTVPWSPQEGIDVGAIERALSSGPKPALVYAMSDGHNPSGASMPVASRQRLAALAREHGVPIVEDDAYGMLSYDGKDLPALRAFEPDWVLYLGSFSKTLAPALRTGWIVAPEKLIGPLASLKEASDIDTATLGQRAIAAFVAAGGFDAHLDALRGEYARRRDAMLGAMATTFPRGTRWSVPRAGFFVWAEMPHSIDATELLGISLEREQVAFLPGPAFAAGDARPAVSSMRLSFSALTPDAIVEGMARLRRSIEVVAATGGGETRRG